ncbi:MAG: helix-turn-helix transcriptional regulator [Leptospirales bacterium]|nr:helix-turn-helix transcriptional regulator [Leptospirales bacterium]
MLLNWLVNAFGAFGGFLAVLLGLFEFVHNGNRWLFSGTLFLVGVIQISLGLTTAGIEDCSVLFAPTILLIGPFAYGSILALVEDDFRFTIWHPGLLLPAATAAVINFYFPAWALVPMILAVCVSLLCSIMLARFLRHVRERRTQMLIAIFLLDFVAIGSLLFLANWIDRRLYTAAQTGITLVICLLYFVKVRFPETATTIRNQVVQARYARTRLNGLDRKELLTRLEHLMGSELYAHENLTLSALARQMELTPHQLSELINREFQMGFFSFVNSFRIKAARELLVRTEKSVLEIAFEVGFNNKSSFNEAFLKFAGTAPVQYRKGGLPTAKMGQEL